MKAANLFLSILLIISTPSYAQNPVVYYSGVENSTPVEYLWSDYDSWYYKKSGAYKGWKYIIIHHSATDAGSVKAFHKFHTQQGYGGIAYHFVIGNGNGMKDGEVQETFRWKQQISGTHVSVNAWDHNIFGIGICLVGNFESSPPTKSQMTALRKLISRLKRTYSIKTKNIIGHKYVKYDDASGRKEQTACPGKKLDLGKLK